MQYDAVVHLHHIEPNAKSDAPASKKNGFEESACTRIGADVNAFFKHCKSFSSLLILYKFVLPCEASQWSSNFGIIHDKDPIKVYKTQETLYIPN
jgi:hypothetical protein